MSVALNPKKIARPAFMQVRLKTGWSFQFLRHLKLERTLRPTASFLLRYQAAEAAAPGGLGRPVEYLLGDRSESTWRTPCTG